MLLGDGAPVRAGAEGVAVNVQDLGAFLAGAGAIVSIVVASLILVALACVGVWGDSW